MESRGGAALLLLRLLRLLLFALPASALPARGNENYLLTAPHPEVLEIGTDFTASCMIINTAEVTADDLYWNVSGRTVPRERYTKVNGTTLNVTITVSGETPEWLLCLCKKVSVNVILNEGRFSHGILLHKGYRPRRPENVSCVALQAGQLISPTITCSWAAAGQQTTDVPTNFTLMVKVLAYETCYASTQGTSVSVTQKLFPNFMEMEIWVVAHNKLGTVESERLRREAGFFVKTDPPVDVSIVSETIFSTSLLLNWNHTLKIQQMGLIYEIRFCPSDSHEWTYVDSDMNKGIQSFRLQDLRPDTVYVSQVRCKNDKEGQGYWSEWSHNATERTPEGLPKGKPDLWKITSEGDDERRVQFVCKDPVFSNGRITGFDLKVVEQKDRVKNGSWSWERIPVNRSEAHGGAVVLREIRLANRKSVKVFVAAVNSRGRSDLATLFIPEKAQELGPVQELRVWPHGGRLWLDWKPPAAVTEYVVQWDAEDQMDWQRENRSSRLVAIKGDLKKFVCYTVSVFPIYSGSTGKAASVQVFLEQSAPLEGPAVRLSGKPGRNEAELTWTQIPLSRRQGFITNYTISYMSGSEVLKVVVPPNVSSYTLTSLLGNTKYDVCISAATVGGSTKGFNHSFTTLKYAPGEIEFIVVGVSLGFLFVVVMTMLLCFYKKDAIKRNFWPQIPNPGESTIGTWTPEYPLKAETPKENCLSGISRLDVDVCDGKSVFEEDKAGLPLKKDKYLSEEHSSGISGSSCMSSPRQSVSDSDEGGDMADTTASTVQYSSVVASNGYKGQTPSSQPPPQAVFSRSESTQPLLDCEENPDVLAPEGSRQSQRFLRHPRSSSLRGNHDPADVDGLREALQPLDFCPLEEDGEQTPPTDEQSAPRPASSYMPQLGGYRPQ